MDPAETARSRAIAAGIVVDGIPESLALGLMARGRARRDGGDRAPRDGGRCRQAVAAGEVVAVLSISVLPYAFREASRPVAVVATAGLALGYVLGA